MPTDRLQLGQEAGCCHAQPGLDILQDQVLGAPCPLQGRVQALGFWEIGKVWVTTAGHELPDRLLRNHHAGLQGSWEVGCCHAQLGQDGAKGRVLLAQKSPSASRSSFSSADLPASGACRHGCCLTAYGSVSRASAASEACSQRSGPGTVSQPIIPTCLQRDQHGRVAVDGSGAVRVAAARRGSGKQPARLWDWLFIAIAVLMIQSSMSMDARRPYHLRLPPELPFVYIPSNPKLPEAFHALGASQWSVARRHIP